MSRRSQSRRNARATYNGPGTPFFRTSATGLVGTSAVANRYETAAATGLVGSAVTGIWTAHLFMVTSQAVAANNRAPGAAFGTGGWRLLTTGTHTQLVHSAGGVSSPAYTFVASDIGRLFLAVCIGDVVGGANRLYVNRAQVGAGAAMASYTVLSAGSGTTLCAVPAGNPSDGLTVYGLCGGTAIPSNAEVLALFDAVKAARSIQAIPGKTTNMWSVPQGTSAPASISDSIGGVTMNLAGALAVSQTSAPFSY